MNLYRRYGKRILDLAITIPALVILSPVLLALYVMSAVKVGRPVFFTQKRAGQNGVIFRLFKFRSMTNAKGPDGALLPDSQRIPPYGAFLRKSSLDELPGLFNVVLGDLSLVGPRPLLPEYLPFYTERHGRRHDVRPGITGLAQINGRQLARFSERMEMDISYVNDCSLLLDLKILLMTIPKVLGSRGVVVGQDVQDVDDLGLSRGLAAASSAG